MRSFQALAAVALITAMSFPQPASALGGEGETWPAFTESSGCGAQRIPTPHADDYGWFSRSELLRGDFAAMFGRTVGHVHTELVRWPIPQSREVLAVHPWMVPALDRAANHLGPSLAADLAYRIDPKTTYSTASRTIAGSLRTSRHTYGTAFDINASRNPHRSDNVLITDIPSWWSQSFRDAGFCWGGLWIGSKDTMHFAWQGPAFSGYESIPLPYPPLTERTPLRYVRTLTVAPPAPTGTIDTVLVDIDNNGARDVVRIATSGSDVVIESSVASWRHNACSSRTSVATGLASVVESAIAMGFGDWDGRGGQDLWVLTNADGSLKLTIRTAFGDLAKEISSRTQIPVPSDDAWISTGDLDVDGAIDLFVVADDTLTVWSVDPVTGSTDVLHQGPLPFTAEADATYALGDVDLDNRPDLWTVVSGTVSVSLAANGYRTVDESQHPVWLPANPLDVSVSDYDGDGRVDLVTFDGERKQVWLGNTELPDDLPLEVWFEVEDPTCEPGDGFGEQRSELRFSSSRWVASGVYEWRSRHRLPTGCDPELDTCVVGLVTNRDLAEFFAWIDGLPPMGHTDGPAAASALAHAGYDLSCPIDDDACWNQPMLASEVAGWFGMFLQARSGVEDDAHRWVLPFWRTASADRLPR